MAPQISPRSGCSQFSFEADECLYRDFDGHRVVVDVEGAGTLSVLRRDASLTPVRGGVEPKEFPIVFRDTLSIAATGPGTFWAQALFDLPTDFAGHDMVVISAPFQGAGWVVDGQETCAVDDRHALQRLDNGFGPIPFFRSIDGTGQYRVVLDPSTRCVLADAWEIGDAKALSDRGWSVQNMSRLRDLDSRFPDGTPHIAQVASHLNSASWTSPIPHDSRGLILRRTFDRFHGRQRARVRIDGEVAGVWYEPREDRSNRWGVGTFGIGAEACQDKTSVRIEIDHPSGVSLWTISRFELWALIPA